MKPYIDVRGPWPVYIKGMIAITLEHCDRNITVDEAETLLKFQGKI